MRRQGAAPARAIVAVPGIRSPTTTRVDEPADEDEDGEHVRERHDEVDHHDGFTGRMFAEVSRAVGVSA
jgi:hypothetical protein